MKYAIIKNGGHQYKVTEGQVIEVERLDTDDKSYVFDQVLLVVDDDNVQIGAPTIEGMKVYADVISEVKGEKIEVFKYKSKSRYRKHTGHRQKYTQVKINGIGTKGIAKPVATKKAKAVEPAVVTSPVNTKPEGRSTKKAPAKKTVVAKKPATKKATPKQTATK